MEHSAHASYGADRRGHHTTGEAGDGNSSTSLPQNYRPHSRSRKLPVAIERTEQGREARGREEIVNFLLLEESAANPTPLQPSACASDSMSVQQAASFLSIIVLGVA